MGCRQNASVTPLARAAAQNRDGATSPCYSYIKFDAPHLKSRQPLHIDIPFSYITRTNLSNALLTAPLFQTSQKLLHKGRIQLIAEVLVFHTRINTGVVVDLYNCHPVTRLL